MTRPVLAILLAASAAPTLAQSPAVIQPSVDSAEQRETLRRFVGCIAKSRPNWARQLLAKPYLSNAQSLSAGEIFGGRDGCLRQPEMEVTFRTSSIVSTLAEHFLRADLAHENLDRLTQRLTVQAPLNASEDFALCVASRAPAAARDLSLSDPSSAAEQRAAEQLAPNIQPCVQKGETLTVDMQGLRGLMSIALYRATGS